MNKPELLAPAGNEKCVYAAVQSGADSIYLGLKNFGARSFAENFDGEALCRVTDYCHLRGVKVYVTLNTLAADVEINDVLESARLCANAGTDGVIVQDIGLIHLFKKHFPELPVHISTQATVMNSGALAQAAELGATRAVVARELSFEEIRSITGKASIETEIFIHGAQCYSYSGQCLMSSIYGGRSGNRGKCAGPCRLPYTLEKAGKPVDKGYLLSPVDMCLGLNIRKVMESGAACLKIEGRMKGPEYVAACCEVYRDALNRGENISREGLKALENTFSRGGFTAGLFEGGENRIKKQSSNDDAYANQQESLLEHYRELARSNSRRLSVKMKFTAKKGEKALLVLETCDGAFSAESEGLVEAAKAAPLEAERIKKQLEKLGDSAFEAEATEVVCDGDIFMPIGEINAMRRQVTALAEQSITRGSKRNYPKAREEKLAPVRAKERFFTASVQTREQAEALLNIDEIKEIYLPAKDYAEGMHHKIVPSFPAIVREKHFEKYLRIMQSLKAAGVTRVRVNEWGMLRAADGLEIYTGGDMNVFNSYSARKLEELGAKRIALSPEMLLKQAGSISSNAQLEVTVYGRLSLMKTANCPLKGRGECGKNSVEYTLSDRKGEKIPVMCRCDDCTAYLLNSKPLYMADKQSEMPANITAFHFDFTVEAPHECAGIADRCLRGEKPDGDFTRGHFFRGVLQGDSR